MSATQGLIFPWRGGQCCICEVISSGSRGVVSVWVGSAPKSEPATRICRVVDLDGHSRK